MVSLQWQNHFLIFNDRIFWKDRLGVHHQFI